MIRNLRLIPSALVLLALASATLAAPAHAASPGFCQDYAETASQQYFRARATPGCTKRTSNLWHAGFQRHFDWCLSAHPAAVRAQTRHRDLAISACDPGYGD